MKSPGNAGVFSGPALGMTKVKKAATARAQTSRMARLPSPAMLMRAPHRLLFFIGASNLLLAMLVKAGVRAGRLGDSTGVLPGI